MRSGVLPHRVTERGVRVARTSEDEPQVDLPWK